MSKVSIAGRGITIAILHNNHFALFFSDVLKDLRKDNHDREKEGKQDERAYSHFIGCCVIPHL